MLSVQIKPEFSIDSFPCDNPLEKTFLRKRFDFFERYQNSEESIHAYLNAVRMLAEYCDFHEADKENLICCRFVSGLEDKQLQSLILDQFAHPSIEQVLNLCTGDNKEIMPADILAFKIVEENVCDNPTNTINDDWNYEINKSSDDEPEETEEEQKKRLLGEPIMVYPEPKEDDFLCKTCPICNATFNNFILLRGHLVEHALYKEFKTIDMQHTDNRLSDTRCQICRRKFDCHDRLVQHYAAHSNETAHLPKLTCTICKKLVAVRYLKRHVSMHNDISTYPCTHCERILNSKHQLKIHMRIHKEHKPNLMCETCGKQFQRQIYLETHKSKLHPILDEKIKSLECFVCKQNFISLTSLKHHLYKHDARASVKNHLCPQCGAGFRANNLLQRHLMRADHDGVANRKFECPICNRKLYDLSQYKNHQLIHSNEKPHKCTYPNCTKAYRIAQKLKQHFRVHTGEKPYKCKLCSYESSHSEYLRRHMRTHAQANWN